MGEEECSKVLRLPVRLALGQTNTDHLLRIAQRTGQGATVGFVMLGDCGLEGHVVIAIRPFMVVCRSVRTPE